MPWATSAHPCLGKVAARPGYTHAHPLPVASYPLSPMTTHTLSALIEPTGELLAEAGAQRPRLGDLLVQAGKLSARDLDRALSAQQEMGSMIGRVLVQLGQRTQAPTGGR